MPNLIFPCFLTRTRRYWYVKLQLGLGDFRLQKHEAISKWYAVVYLVLVYLYWQKYEYDHPNG